MDLTITLAIVIVTCIISIGGFNNARIIDDLIFYPPAITERKQVYRFFSCGLIHADFLHLAFNMYALYTFGTNVENGIRYAVPGGDTVQDNGFIQLFGLWEGKMLYLLMYILALGFCLLPTFFRHKHDYHYRSLGASGAVSAVIFAAMILEPRIGVGLIFIPGVNIPGYVFAPLFLVISHFLARKGNSRINHSAHIWGAIFGILFVIITCYALSSHDVIASFIRTVRRDTGF
jgi:membrane associated rhomboid family serine protease